MNGQKSSEYRYHPYDDLIQFVIEPDTDSPGEDPRAVTSPRVDDFYSDDDNLVYWDTSGEPAPYIIYHIVFEGDGGDPGFVGFTATPVDFDRKGKPITWVIAPKEVEGKPLPMRLCVASPDWFEGREGVTLATYEDGLPFEFAVSIVPLTEYPGASAAPARHRSISTTWGDIKEQ